MLEEASVEYNISPEETQLIERLGGRASDLETVRLNLGAHVMFAEYLHHRSFIKSALGKVSPMP